MVYNWLFQDRPLVGENICYVWEPGELKACIQAVQKQDLEAQSKLCRSFEALVRSIAIRISLKYGFQGEDVLSSAWEHFWNLIMTYNGTDEEYDMLPGLMAIRIKSRVLRDYCNDLRYAATQGTNIDDEDNPELQELASTNDIEKQILYRSLQQAMQHLPPKQQRIIQLSFYDNLNIEQIATELKLSERRIYQLREKALTQLEHLIS